LGSHFSYTNLSDRLHLLKDLYREVVIPREVKIEALDLGLEKDFPDAINEGWIKVEEMKLTQEFTGMAQIAGLRIAEASVICYSYKNEGTALIDEDSARTLA